MSFHAKRAERSSKTVTWSTPPPAPVPMYALQDAPLTIAHGAWGRGLRATRAIQAGETLLIDDAYVRVLRTTEAVHRCHFCLAKEPHLQVCASCDFARYCDDVCEASARPWHKRECAALQRHKDIPDADVRALAQLLWLKSERTPAWWAPLGAMASNRHAMQDHIREEAAMLAFRLGIFLGTEEREALGLTNADELMELVCQHMTNAFMLSDAYLDPLGVCVNPTLALVNHACDANVVMVYPTMQRGSPSRMHLVAIRPISAGDAVLMSYVDVATSRAERQAVLQERYGFTCACALCERTQWIDPRTALWCTSCPEWSGSAACGHRRTEPRTLDMGEDTDPDILVHRTALAPPSHYRVWPLLFAAHTRAIERQAWDDAVQCTMLLCAGMQARGARDARSALYPPGHPQRAVLLATLGRLLCENVELHDTPSHLLARPLPCLPMLTDMTSRRFMAHTFLTQALEEACIAFGHDGGAIGALARACLAL